MTRLKQSQSVISHKEIKKKLTGILFNMRTIIWFIPVGFSVIIVITDKTLILLITANVILGIHSHNTFVRKSYARLPVGCDLI